MTSSRPVFKRLFLILCIISGILILYPYHDFQPWLSTGDHGRDLYSFKKTLDGKLPYRDYWWVYGPLMPYYYSLCYFFFGINIKSVLLGAAFLNLLAGIIFYFTISFFVAPSFAFIATLWFWTFQQNFFFTYNHIGGIVAYLGTIYCLFSYIKKPLRYYIYLGLVSIFIFALIKLNLGLATLFAFVGSLCIIDFVNRDFSSGKIRFYALSFSLFLFIVAAIYWRFLNGLPFYYIRLMRL